MTNILEDAKGGRQIPRTAKAATLLRREARIRLRQRPLDRLRVRAVLRPRQACPAEVVDELYAGVRKVRVENRTDWRSYVELMKGKVKGPPSDSC